MRPAGFGVHSVTEAHRRSRLDLAVTVRSGHRLALEVLFANAANSCEHGDRATALDMQGDGGRLVTKVHA